MNRRARIGVFVNDLLSPYQIRLFNSIKRSANLHGMRVIGFLGSFLVHPEQERRTAFDGSFVYGLAGEESVDGLILVTGVLSSRAGSDAVRDLCQRTELPVVSVGRLNGVCSIETGASEALRALVDHVVNYHQRRKIALIEGPPGNPDTIERSRIVRTMLTELNVELLDSHVVQGDFLESSGATAIRTLLERRGVTPAQLDAIVCCNDQMAVGAIRELESRGIRVPQQVAVIGFDDDDFARSANPPLTTISQPLEMMGEQAIHAMLAKMRGEPVPERIVIEAEPVWRRSCGCATPMNHQFSSAEPLVQGTSLLEYCKTACQERFRRLAGQLGEARIIDTAFALILDVHEDELSQKRHELETYILRAWNNGVDPLRWHDVLSPMSNYVDHRTIPDGDLGRQRARRLRRVSLLINEIAARVRALDHLHIIQWAHASRVLAGALLSVRHVRSLASVLSAGLPSLNIRYCCVCLFVGDEEPRTARVAALYNPSLPPPIESPRSAEQLWLATPGSVPPEQVQNLPVNSVFPALELIHPRLRNSSADALDLSVYPLVYAHATLGYVVFDAPTDAHQSWLLEGLAGSLSSAVYALERNVELREARDRAEKANAAKTEFVAMISHEVRTPLTAILGHLDLCLQTEMTAEQKHHLQQAKTSSRALLGIVNDILDFSKIEAQKIELEWIPFALDDVLDQVVATCAQPAARKGLRLIVDVQPDLPHWLRGDALRLSQVLLNLVGNAVKFSSHGDVRVEVSQGPWGTASDVSLKFVVEDEGIGMTAEEIARIFEPFTQGDGSMTRRYGGTGLGLTISRRLVALMHGEISVASEVGRGSRFEFTALLKRCELPTDELARGTHKNLLLIGADERQQLTLEHLLTSYGFGVTRVSTAKETQRALETATGEGFVFDLIICDRDDVDSQVPAILREMAGVLKRCETHILMLTAAEGDSIETAGLPRLAGVIQKPYQRRHLIQVIARALSLSRSYSPGERVRNPSYRVPEGTRILVVQDDPTTSEVLYEVLTRTGAQVSMAKCGSEAIEFVKNHVYHLILQDLHLPDMDGYSTAQAIRATPYGVAVPIVALSASAARASLSQCLAAGINDFVPAPIDAEGLKHVVQLWVGRHEHRDAPFDTATPLTFSGVGRASSNAPSSRRSFLDLDTEGAINRLGDDNSLYSKLLARFIVTQNESLQTLRLAIERANTDGAVLAAHTLASAAGNIGANRMFQVAKDLEARLAAQDIVEVSEQMTDLELACNRALQAARGFLSENAVPEHASAAPLVGGWSELSTQLRELIVAHDSAALDHVQALRTALGARVAGGEAFQRLESSISAYDFERALSQLETLSQALAAQPLSAGE